MRYYKGYIALSEACDVPVLLHVRNARAICFDQLFELISLEMEATLVAFAPLARRASGESRPPFTAGDIPASGETCLRNHAARSRMSRSTRPLSALLAEQHRADSAPIAGAACARIGEYPNRAGEGRLASLVEKRTRNHFTEPGCREFSDQRLMTLSRRSSSTETAEGWRSSMREIRRRRNRYRAIRDVLDKDETADTILYLTSNDDILYLLAVEMRSCRRQIGFALSESFRRSLARYAHIDEHGRLRRSSRCAISLRPKDGNSSSLPFSFLTTHCWSDCGCNGFPLTTL